MISDEELKQFADICPESYMQTLKPVLEQANISVGDEFDGFKKIQEIAQELLQRREAEKKTDAFMDSQYIAGARMGWNCGVENKAVNFLAAIKSRRKEIVEARHD